MDDKEVAEINKIQSEADAVYLDRDVLQPMEIRNSRFGKESSLKTTLNSNFDNNNGK
jgi:hypothetical protein